MFHCFHLLKIVFLCWHQPTIWIKKVSNFPFWEVIRWFSIIVIVRGRFGLKRFKLNLPFFSSNMTRNIIYEIGISNLRLEWFFAYVNCRLEGLVRVTFCLGWRMSSRAPNSHTHTPYLRLELEKNMKFAIHFEAVVHMLYEITFKSNYQKKLFSIGEHLCNWHRL